MTAAMKMVRDALGEDAVIMASNTDKAKGIVTVTAAIDTDAVAEKSASVSITEPNPAKKPLVSLNEEGDAMTAVDVIAQALEDHGCPRRLVNKILRYVDDADYVTHPVADDIDDGDNDDNDGDGGDNDDNDDDVNDVCDNDDNDHSKDGSGNSTSDGSSVVFIVA
jgi:flagellar biosynthesis GTPase FlhF